MLNEFMAEPVYTQTFNMPKYSKVKVWMWKVTSVCTWRRRRTIPATSFWLAQTIFNFSLAVGQANETLNIVYAHHLSNFFLFDVE